MTLHTLSKPTASSFNITDGHSNSTIKLIKNKLFFAIDLYERHD